MEICMLIKSEFTSARLVEWSEEVEEKRKRKKEIAASGMITARLNRFLNALRTLFTENERKKSG
jgi:hypothetical protein